MERQGLREADRPAPCTARRQVAAGRQAYCTNRQPTAISAINDQPSHAGNDTPDDLAVEVHPNEAAVGARMCEVGYGTVVLKGRLGRRAAKRTCEVGDGTVVQGKGPKCLLCFFLCADGAASGPVCGGGAGRVLPGHPRRLGAQDVRRAGGEAHALGQGTQLIVLQLLSNTSSFCCHVVMKCTDHALGQGTVRISCRCFIYLSPFGEAQSVVRRRLRPLCV